MSAQLAKALRGMLDLLDDSSDLSRRLAIKDAQAALAAFEAAPQQAQAPSDIQRRFDNLLASEHALSNSYVRIREIIGAMNPPVLEPAALYAYVEDCARKFVQQAQAPIDPDGEQSRAGFRAFDEAQVARWAAPWQVWREAVKWAAQQAQAPGWQPIATAPENTEREVVVQWMDSDGAICRDLDYRKDGCWMGWHSHAEHVEVIGGHGVSYTPPYTKWMPLPAAQSAGELQAVDRSPQVQAPERLHPLHDPRPDAGLVSGHLPQRVPPTGMEHQGNDASPGHQFNGGGPAGGAGLRRGLEAGRFDDGGLAK